LSASLLDRPESTVAPAMASRLTLFVALIFGVAAALLSFLGSWIPSLWGDEVTSVLSAERSLPSLFRMLGHVDAVHGTYYLFLHFWVDIFGASPVSVRFPSAIAVGITVVGVVLLGTRLSTPRAGVFAGVICVVLPRITYTGQEARSYAFSVACAVWLTLLLIRLISDRSPKRRYWILYTFGIAVSSYVFLFSLLLMVAHFVTVVAMHRRTLTIRWAKALATALVLALPVIIYGVAERGQIAFLANRSAATWNSVTVGQWFGSSLCAEVCWVLIAAAIIWSLRQWRRTRRSAIAGSLEASAPDRPNGPLLATVWLLAPPAILLTVNFVDPIYSSRYLTFATPAAAILIGLFLAQIRPKWIAIPIAAAVVAASAPNYFAQRTPYAENASDWAADAAVIHAHARAGDGILFDETINPSKRPRLGMRAYPAAFVGLKDVALKTPWWATNNWFDAISPLADVSGQLNGVTTVWLIEYRAAGGKADTYDRSTLATLGYVITATYHEHSSVIFEMKRP
jgi:mannosyltransferase